MKKSLITTLVAVPLLSLSSMAFAAEPVLLTASEMDGVTAGADASTFSFKFAEINQVNISPVATVQLSVLSVGGNSSTVHSGNSAVIVQ